MRKGLCWLAVVGLLACGGSKPARRGGTYGENARAAYETALEDFRDDDCTAAEPIFQQVRRDFPYSSFAALAELRLADCLRKQKKYAEAVQAYQRFVRFHPSHAEVPYAEFGVADAYYRQIPKSWILSTPAHERDQSSTHDAARQLRRFIADYPGDRRVPEARSMLRKTLDLLAGHELYAAKYYLRRSKPIGAILRLQALLTEYQGSGLEPQALFLLAKTYRQVKQPEPAKRSLDTLLQRYPKSPEAEKARALSDARQP